MVFNIFSLVLFTSSFVVATHSYKCFNTACSSVGYCDIIIDGHKNIHGKCSDVQNQLAQLCSSTQYQPTTSHPCRCSDAVCVSRVTNAYAAHSYGCLGLTCHSNEFCQLYISGDDDHSGRVKSKCITHKSSLMSCINHDSILSNSHGCYCNSSTCVSNVAIHAGGVICPVPQVMKVMGDNGRLHVACQTDRHGLHECSLPFTLGRSRVPCVCSSQICANNIGVSSMTLPTTSTLRTTTTLATTSTSHTAPATTAKFIRPSTTQGAMAQTFPYCVTEKCGNFNPYCHLYEHLSEARGNCRPFKVGPQCTTYKDLRSSGCHCLLDHCVAAALTDYAYHTVTTVMYPTSSTTLMPGGIFCITELCQFGNKYCRLYENQGVVNGKCMTIHLSPPCTTYQDIFHACHCTKTECVREMLLQYTNYHETSTKLPSTSTTSFPSTRTLPTTSTVSSTTHVTPLSTIPSEVKCFGQNCLSNQICRIIRASDTAFVGFCKDLVLSQFIPCYQRRDEFQDICDCWSQHCVDVYSATQSTIPTSAKTTLPMSSTSTTTTPVILTTDYTSSSSTNKITTPTSTSMPSSSIHKTSTPVPKGENGTSTTNFWTKAASVTTNTTATTTQASNISILSTLPSQTSGGITKLVSMPSQSFIVLTVQPSTQSQSPNVTNTATPTTSQSPNITTVPTTNSSNSSHVTNVLTSTSSQSPNVTLVPTSKSSKSSLVTTVPMFTSSQQSNITTALTSTSLQSLNATLVPTSNSSQSSNVTTVSMSNSSQSSSVPTVAMPTSSQLSNVTTVHMWTSSQLSNVTILPMSTSSLLSNLTMLTIPTTLQSSNVTTEAMSNSSQLSNVATVPLSTPSQSSNVTTVTKTTPPQPSNTTTVPMPTPSQHFNATTVLTSAIVGSCHICGDKESGIPCSTREIYAGSPVHCGNGKQYCMTDVKQDEKGNIDVIKRCVDQATCLQEWILESADLDYCKRYGDVKNQAAFQCHFCCDGYGCNSEILPNSTTWFRYT